MIDFTSSLYLGMKHSSADLAPWQQLTTGVPSALFDPPQSKGLACQIANMQGLEYGLTAPSTLHLYHDLYSLLSKQAAVVFIDENIYPISKYGIEKVHLNKIPVYQFRHLDAAHLQELVVAKTVKLRTPVVITDGWCPQCGRPAPLNVYSEILKPFAGKIVIDDTQAFGVFGKRIGKEVYGMGGGGILNWLNVNHLNVISIVSLAKAFGVPLAVISGSSEFITSFKNNSQTIAYSSPPSLVHLRAGLHSVHINKEIGDYIRQKLSDNVSLLRSLLKGTGLNVNGGIFPVQSLRFRDADKTTDIFDDLIKQRIRTVLTTSHQDNMRYLTFVIRSDHSTRDIETLAYCIQKAVNSEFS